MVVKLSPSVGGILPLITSPFLAPKILFIVLSLLFAAVLVVFELCGVLVVTEKRVTLRRALFSSGILEHCCFTSSIVIFSSFCENALGSWQRISRISRICFIMKFW